MRKTRGDVADVIEGPLTVPARTPKSSKSARAYSKKYSLGPPLVPQLIADKLETYYKKHFRQKAQFVQLICKYWSLKREARRGAPLLKRLHLEVSDSFVAILETFRRSSNLSLLIFTALDSIDGHKATDRSGKGSQIPGWFRSMTTFRNSHVL